MADKWDQYIVPEADEWERYAVMKEPASEKPDLLSRIGTDIGKAYTELTTPVEAEGGMTDTTVRMAEKGLYAAGHLGTAALDAMTTAIGGIYNLTTTEKTRQRQRETVSDLGESIGETDFGKRQVATLRDIKRALEGVETVAPRFTKAGEAGANAFNLIPAYQAAKFTLPAAKAAAKAGLNVAKEVASDVASSKPARWVTGRPDPDEAMRQVLQSKGKAPGIIERDVEKGWKALSEIDTTGDKVFTDTIGKIDKAIPDLAKQVDDLLTKDPKVYSLGELSTVGKTKSGAEVSTNYVKDSIDHLKELYEKTGDPVKAGNMGELLAKAETGGLTRKEVNDLARTYGSEYKAFNKTTGERLTSVSSEAYEVARRGLDDTAKELDSTISSLYNTKRLMEQNAAASMKLQQKYNERGILEKAGNAIINTADLLTGHLARGAVKALFPSGIGMKVRNTAEIEGKLARNLKIINKEIERLDKIKPTGPLEGPPPEYATRGFRGNERLGQPDNMPPIPPEEVYAGNPPPRPYIESPLPSGTSRVALEQESLRKANLSRIQEELAGAGAADITPWAQWLEHLKTINPLQWTEKDLQMIQNLQKRIDNQRI
jgi:hypothetical protein